MTTAAPTVETPFATAADWNALWAESGDGAPPMVRSDDDIAFATLTHPSRGAIPVVIVRCTLPRRVSRDAMVRNEQVERALARRIGASALAVTPGPRQNVIVIRFIPQTPHDAVSSEESR